MRDSDGGRTSNRLKTATVIWVLSVVAFALAIVLLATGLPSWAVAVAVGAAVGSVVAALMSVRKAS